MVKSLEIPELKGDAFARTSKLDFIDKQSRTLQELYTEVTGMTRKACNCNHTLRRTFYDFAYHSLRSLHNDLSARLGDLESEKDGMTEEEKRNLKNLVSYRDGRESQIIQLERRWIRLFSPVCYQGKKFSTSLLHSVRWIVSVNPLESVNRTCCNSKGNYSFCSKHHSVYNKISSLPLYY